MPISFRRPSHAGSWYENNSKFLVQFCFVPCSRDGACDDWDFPTDVMGDTVV